MIIKIQKLLDILFNGLEVFNMQNQSRETSIILYFDNNGELYFTYSYYLNEYEYVYSFLNRNRNKYEIISEEVLSEKIFEFVDYETLVIKLEEEILRVT